MIRIWMDFPARPNTRPSHHVTGQGGGRRQERRDDPVRRQEPGRGSYPADDARPEHRPGRAYPRWGGTAAPAPLGLCSVMS